jgi:hypothetical protein
MGGDEIVKMKDPAPQKLERSDQRFALLSTQDSALSTVF